MHVIEMKERMSNSKNKNTNTKPTEHFWRRQKKQLHKQLKRWNVKFIIVKHMEAIFSQSISKNKNKNPLRSRHLRRFSFQLNVLNITWVKIYSMISSFRLFYRTCIHATHSQFFWFMSIFIIWLLLPMYEYSVGLLANEKKTLWFFRHWLIW